MSEGNNFGNPSPASDGLSDEEGYIDGLYLIGVLAKYKRVVIGIPVIAAVISLTVALLLPKSYLGVARILPVQQSQSIAMSLLSQVGGGSLAALAGPALGVRGLADLYVGILKSQNIADALIERFGLKELYHEDTLVDTRDTLEGNTTLKGGRDGIILIEVEDEDPARAAKLANGYVEELQRLTQNLAISEAGVRRAFFERQLKQTKDSLAEAEVQLRTVQEKTGLLKLEEQGKAIIESVAAMRAQIAVKEVQLAAMRSFATGQNPDYLRVRQEFSEMRLQLEKLEKAQASVSPNVLIPTASIPEVGLEYVRKFRDVKYYEVMFESLAKQFELARLDEANDAVVIQVVDNATPPDKKYKPKRGLIVILSTLVAFVFVVIGVFLKEALGHMQADPIRSARLREIKDYLSRWR
jgi:tyrosine-protein kinase Etk/Wzc